MGRYEGSGFETGRKSYYFSAVGGHAVFSQGIMQTVQNTAMGVDIRNGRTLTGITGGKIDNATVNMIKAELQAGREKSRKEALMPVYDATGVVVGYERALSPEMIQLMRKNDHLGEMIGAWAGRHVEEAVAQEFNKKLVDSLKKIWDRDSGTGRRGDFVDISKKGATEIQKDAWNMIPRETKEMIEDVFGDDGFMVRKDMLDNAVGYRSMSIGEAWAGPSNMKPETKKAIRDFATAIRGKNAYRDLVTATKFIQAGVGVAKNIIVVTSIVVPVANAASNVQQLMTLGVGPRDIINGLKIKLVEVAQLQKMEERRVEITALKAVNASNEIQLRKLLAEEKSIDDAISRMSIAPMVKAGEFTTGSGGLHLIWTH